MADATRQDQALQIVRQTKSLRPIIKFDSIVVNGIEKGLSRDIVQLQLEKQFKYTLDSGVKDIKVITDHTTHEPLGHAYINYVNEKKAQQSILKNKYNVKINGKNVKMMYSVKPNDVIHNDDVKAMFSVCIKNLDPSVDLQMLDKKFEEFGDILRSFVGTDKFDQRYALIQYIDQSSAIKAVTGGQGMKFYNTVLQVEAYTRTGYEYSTNNNSWPEGQQEDYIVEQTPNGYCEYQSQQIHNSHSQQNGNVKFIPNGQHEANAQATALKVNGASSSVQTPSNSDGSSAKGYAGALQGLGTSSSGFLSNNNVQSENQDGFDVNLADCSGHFQNGELGLARPSPYYTAAPRSATHQRPNGVQSQISQSSILQNSQNNQWKREPQTSSPPPLQFAHSLQSMMPNQPLSQQLELQQTQQDWERQSGLANEIGDHGGVVSFSSQNDLQSINNQRTYGSMDQVGQQGPVLDENNGLSKKIDKQNNNKKTNSNTMNSSDRWLMGFQHELSCPISLTLFVDPVMASDGQLYERSEIQDWLDKGKRTSPLKGTAITCKLDPVQPLATAMSVISTLRNNMDILEDKLMKIQAICGDYFN